MLLRLLSAVLGIETAAVRPSRSAEGRTTEGRVLAPSEPEDHIPRRAETRGRCQPFSPGRPSRAADVALLNPLTEQGLHQVDSGLRNVVHEDANHGFPVSVGVSEHVSGNRVGLTLIEEYEHFAAPLLPIGPSPCPTTWERLSRRSSCIVEGQRGRVAEGEWQSGKGRENQKGEVQ